MCFHYVSLSKKANFRIGMSSVVKHYTPPSLIVTWGKSTKMGGDEVSYAKLLSDN